MELTNKQIKQIYDEYIDAMNSVNGATFKLLMIEKDHVHALIEISNGENVRYQLCVIREFCDRNIVTFIHSWGEEEYPLARIAFRCFCHEEPEEIGKMREGNRQIALYSDEARRKDELISELIDKSGAL